MNAQKNTLAATVFMLKKVLMQPSGIIYMLIKVFLSIVDAVVPVVLSVIPGLIINELLNANITKKIIVYVTVLLCIPMLNSLIHIFLGKMAFFSVEKITLFNLKEFYCHVTRMDYETLECPEIQDKKSRAVDILGNNYQVVDNLCGLLSALIKLILISSIIIVLNPFIILIIMIIVALNTLITRRLDKKGHELNKIIQSKERLQWGINFMLDMIQYAKDLRLFRINDFLVDKLLVSEKNINIEKRKMASNQNIANVFYTILNFINQLTLYVYLIYMVIFNGLAVGSMTIFLSAAGQFSSALSGVSNSFLTLSAFALRINDYLDFMSIPQKQYLSGNLLPEFDNNSKIEFRNVSFKYNGSDRYAIKNLSLTVHANQKLCIVGENGVGKSTFIKLLTRLYFPTSGEILLNGININEYDYEKYQRLFSAVFQDFSKFYMTLGENIVLADKYNKARLDKVCKDSGIESLVEKLPKGYDTQVDKWIDEEGFEPSGGENQRIAIARACYHGGDIFLLDEPTAALDPMAEYEIYNQFNNMITDKCAILITHRLSAVQLADKVAVFDDGHVAEYGTHAKLYAKGGIYTEMFDKQARFYRDKPSESDGDEECE